MIFSFPRFLFKKEPGVEGVRQLSEHELAIRLAYFLWSSPPDKTLLKLAEEKQLKENLSQQVKRMIADVKARHFVDGLAHQWLDMKRLDFFQFGLKITESLIKVPEMHPVKRFIKQFFIF